MAINCILTAAGVSVITTIVLFAFFYRKQFENTVGKLVNQFDGYLGMLDEENLDIKEENYKLKKKLEKSQK